MLSSSIRRSVFSSSTAEHAVCQKSLAMHVQNKFFDASSAATQSLIIERNNEIISPGETMQIEKILLCPPGVRRVDGTIYLLQENDREPRPRVQRLKMTGSSKCHHQRCSGLSEHSSGSILRRGPFVACIIVGQCIAE